MDRFFCKKGTAGNLKYGIGFWFFVLLLYNAYCEDVGRGGYAGSFLRMGLGARAMGMGGGSVALANDGYATYYNPAGLVSLEKRWFTVTLNSMALDRRVFYVGYAQSFEKKGQGMLKAGFSVGWLCAGVDDIPATDFNGNDMGTLSSWEHCFFFSFAVRPVSWLSMGLSVKVLNNRFPNITDAGQTVSATGSGFDLGMMIRPVRSISLGFVVKDLQSRYTWDTQKLWDMGTQTYDHFPQIVRGGILWELFSGRVAATLDLEKVEYWPLGYAVGLEMVGYKEVFLRSGIRNGDFAFGVGCRLPLMGKTTRLDYAFVPVPVAPRGDHVFTWSFLF